MISQRCSFYSQLSPTRPPTPHSLQWHERDHTRHLLAALLCITDRCWDHFCLCPWSNLGWTEFIWKPACIEKIPWSHSAGCHARVRLPCFSIIYNIYIDLHLCVFVCILCVVLHLCSPILFYYTIVHDDVGIFVWG